MERNAEIKFSLTVCISLFIHMILFMAVVFRGQDTFTSLMKGASVGSEGALGRDIIVNVNQDGRKDIKKTTLLSDKDSSAKGYITKTRGDNWLNNALDFIYKRGSTQTGASASKSSGSGEKRGLLLSDNSEVVVSIAKYTYGGDSIFGNEGTGDFNRIPDRYNFTRKNSIYYSNDGRFSFNTMKFRDFNYFKSMKDRIASNWFPPLLANAAIGGYAPGRIRIMAIPNQEVRLYFVMNRKGDVLDVVIVESMGNGPLDASCVDAIKMSKSFGKVPDDIPGEQVMIRFIFGYYLY
jgi:TonB family protein